MNIRFYNARILAPSEGHSFQVITGELWVKKDEIIYIGDGLDTERVFEKEPAGMILWDREIDAEKNLLLPGFKNAHTHTAMTFLRSWLKWNLLEKAKTGLADKAGISERGTAYGR